LLLCRFAADDVDNLTGLDGDPEVIRFITGGRTTPREEIEKDLVPAFLSYYERYDGLRLLASHREGERGFPGLVPLPAGTR
jgi:hypothetical protein